MKGVIFNVFEAFVIAHHGEEALDDIVDATDLETAEPFVGPGNYPAGDLVALLGTAVDKTGIPADELLRQCGRFAFPTLAGSVPTLMADFDGAEAFLLGLESVIHTEVRKLDPDASPARFTTTSVAPGELEMHYASPFGLFGLVEGLIEGVADWFATPLSCEIGAIDGTNATFRIRVSPSAASVANGVDAANDA